MDLYFHAPCFDGAVSAAIASTYFSHVRGVNEITLHGVNYRVSRQWLSLTLATPSAVVDFLYHPMASFWADHHPTTFLTEDVKQHFDERRGRDVFYDSEATSCALLIWHRLGAAIAHAAQHFEPLVYWADRIDSARYESVDEAILLPSPALRINLVLGTSKDETFAVRLVEMLQDLTLEEIAMLPEVEGEFNRSWRLQQQGLDRVRKRLNVSDQSIAVFDVDGDNVLINRYAPFYLFPRARYSAGIVRTGGSSKITIMRNPWIDFPSAPLGEFCVPFGGGGHRRVGSIYVQHRDAKDVLSQLLDSIARWHRQASTEDHNDRPTQLF